MKFDIIKLPRRIPHRHASFNTSYNSITTHKVDNMNIKYTIRSIVCEASCHHVISLLFSILLWTDGKTNEQHQDLRVCLADNNACLSLPHNLVTVTPDNDNDAMFQVEVRPDVSRPDRSVHLLEVASPSSSDLAAVWECSAGNSVGTTSRTISLGMHCRQDIRAVNQHSLIVSQCPCSLRIFDNLPVGFTFIYCVFKCPFSI